jgi:signal transduction histidine kinase
MAQHGTGRAGESLNGLSFAAVLHDCLACAVLAVDEHERVAALNDEAEEFVRPSAPEVAGPTLARLPEVLQQLVRATLLTGQPVVGREIILRHSAEAERTLRVTAALKARDAAKGREVIVVLHDVTLAKRMEAGMPRLERLASIGTLSASMAHEIRNALTTVKTFVELLRQQNPAAELSDLTVRELRRIDSIVSQMLRFAGPARPTFAPLRLHEILDRSLRLVQPQLEGQRIKVKRLYGARPDRINGDEYQLEQAVINLFLNAIEAMVPEGQLTVRTGIAPPSPQSGPNAPTNAPALRLEVEDTGAGIAPENLDRLFEPFFTTKPSGTGLGLPITRRIVEEHQGTLTVRSEFGQGATFTILLPLLQKGHRA